MRKAYFASKFNPSLRVSVSDAEKRTTHVQLGLHVGFFKTKKMTNIPSDGLLNSYKLAPGAIVSSAFSFS